MTSRRTLKVDWVTMGPDGVFATCQRCKGTIPSPILPAPIEAIVSYADYAMRLHRWCKS